MATLIGGFLMKKNAVGKQKSSKEDTRYNDLYDVFDIENGLLFSVPSLKTPVPKEWISKNGKS